MTTAALLHKLWLCTHTSVTVQTRPWAM